ncbi:MAG TPA: UDP-N-acetylmuramoyl-tripeptide--D-alanyl-D-alanine ligase, partial [Caulobacteraceae bacterium]|nr:UDP-N-acetylmuramoyl-tripeptide--D-alanyl-D-alanine ligase [Caulobacteraceae bacterium]
MTEALWTSAEIVGATGGALAGPAFEVGGISIDSRSVEPGDLFVAMAGVRDGHDFVPAALAAGAAGAMTLRPMGTSSIVVEDTLKALERLGEAARIRAPKVRRGAVTGSVGKTSVTQAIRVGLELAGRAHGSVKSYNNHIGVPLTLARMPRASERAIFEIGMNHAGEIRPLARMVQPQAVAITTVGPVHVENFPDAEAGVARSKAEIFEGLQSGGVAVLNADDR